MNQSDDARVTSGATIAFLPTTPMLLPELATGAAEELSALRDAAMAAVDEVCAAARRVAVLVPGEGEYPLESWSVRGFGLDVGDGSPQPLPVGIAGWLLAGRPAQVVGSATARLYGFDGVLVMGDGSTTRTDKAPGHFDPRAIPFDDGVRTAIADGDAKALARLDTALAAQVGSDAAPLWQMLARNVASVDQASLLATEDRYGVFYLVATWRVRWADPAPRAQ